jgi:hypothetical protein
MKTVLARRHRPAGADRSKARDEQLRKAQEEALRQANVEALRPAGPVCQHHWLLGQPRAGLIQASCRKCGTEREYPAVLDDIDPPGIEIEPKTSPVGVATAGGGARPSTTATGAKLMKDTK